MTYPIELISIGSDLSSILQVVAAALNAVQVEFQFSLPPPRLRAEGLALHEDVYDTAAIFDWLKGYRVRAKGSRPYLIALTHAPLKSLRYTNLFAGHNAKDGLAVVTTHDVSRFIPNLESYISYYLIRNALSFVAPQVRNHKDTRNCLFDMKLYRPDILVSLKSGRICDEHSQQLKECLNDETEKSVQAMIAVLFSMVHLSDASRSSTVVASPGSGRPAFVWLHLSDIHVGAGDEHWRFDQRAVARAIVADVASCPWPPARIFVTGDVAFSAKQEQYERAYEWLKELASSAKTSIETVRVVPGNHDVDRNTAGSSLLRVLHAGIRQKPRDLDGVLQDETGRTMMSTKLNAFQSFMAKLSAHPLPLSYGLDWVESIPLSEGQRGTVRVVGISSVWVSDQLDGRSDHESSHFVPNMLVGLLQLEKTLGNTGKEEMVFVLTHHPPSWMAADSATVFARALAPLSHVHLCGHVHQAQARLEKDFGKRGASLRYVAGATHADPTDSSEARKHGYAWGALRQTASGWQIGWAPRIYVSEIGKMRADSTRYDLDQDGFAWEAIVVPWR